ncbi:MAG: hypothetical protein NTZ67_08925 [Gammaproteobacteria bacterium]|nr:hypothetical protein [Gammaproteobacteria bacterium]
MPFYDSTYGVLNSDAKLQLLTMTSATIDRPLKATHDQYPKRMGGTLLK